MKRSRRVVLTLMGSAAVGAVSMGFTPREFFELSSEAERQAPRVSFEPTSR